jgi:excisionase family DNA binding protein
MTDRLDAALRELADAIRAEVAAAGVPAPDRLLGIDEAAAMLGLGRSRVYGLIAGGELGSLKVGRRRLIPSSAIREFIEDGRP